MKFLSFSLLMLGQNGVQLSRVLEHKRNAKISNVQEVHLSASCCGTVML